MKSAKTFNLSRDVLDSLKSWKETNSAHFSPSDLVEMLLREYLKLEVPVLTIGSTLCVDTKIEKVVVERNELKENFLKKCVKGFNPPYTQDELTDYIRVQSVLSEDIAGIHITEEEIRNAFK